MSALTIPTHRLPPLGYPAQTEVAIEVRLHWLSEADARRLGRPRLSHVTPLEAGRPMQEWVFRGLVGARDAAEAEAAHDALYAAALAEVSS